MTDRSMTGWTYLWIALATALVAGLAGCLEFDEQTISMEHDAATDRLIVVFQYKGLYAGEEVEKATRQLEEAIERRTVAFGDNWPFAFSVKEMREALNDPDEDMAEWPADFLAQARALLDRVEVLHGGFYKDAEGRVCGTQVVTVRRAAETVPQVNAFINRAFLLAEERGELTDEEALPFIELARQGHEWLRLKGHSLIVSLPVSDQQMAEGRRDMFDDMLNDDELLRGPYGLLGLRDVLSNQIFVWHEDGMLRVKLGLDTLPAVFTVRPRTGDYEPNLVAHVEETYGFHLNGLLALYLSEPDAPAAIEAARAAKLMAPRLSKQEQVWALVRALESGAGDGVLAALRAIAPEPDMPEPEDESEAALVKSWQTWLEDQIPEPEFADEEE